MSSSFHSGQRVGDYEIVSTLGRGGLGAVYEARHVISNRREAIKVLLPDQIGTGEMAERFRREIQMLAALNHPHIAALHNAFYFGEQLVMVMELVVGETLRSRSARSELNLPQVVGIAEQALAALEYAHTNRIVHRDIKPSNIMIAAHDCVKVLDFGIALAEQSPDLTTAGSVLGSLSYMSPEQVSGGRATPQSDLYSFGVTLYELVTGRLPFAGASSYEIMTGHVQHTPTPPIQWNPALPISFSNAILTALAKQESDRFASAQRFSDALQASLFADAHTVTMPMLATPQAARSGSGSGSASGNGSQAAAGRTPTPSASSRSTPQPGSLAASATQNAASQIESITRELAAYIGPIARIVVRRLANHCTDTEQLYAEAAREIADPAARARFLAARRRG